MITEAILKKCEQGDVQAMLEVANAHYNGEDGNVDYNKAFSLYAQILSIDPNHAAANNNLGDCYSYGYGVAEDKSKAFEYYKNAALLGMIDGQYNLAYCYKTGEGTIQDYSKAKEWFQKAALSGDSRSMVELGNLFEKGLGVEKNFSIAFSCYKQAADRNDQLGLSCLAYCYKYGVGVEVDNQKAFELWLSSAKQGNVTSQFNVGKSYRNGDGVTQDLVEAKKWLKLAADQGDGEAENDYAELLLNNTHKTSDDIKDGISYLIRSTEAGYLLAYFNLGLIYYNGEIVPKDLSKALAYWTKGGNAGMGACSRNAASMYRDGEGVPKNLDLSLRWYKQAIHQEDSVAAVTVGLAYFLGEDFGEQNYAKAKAYFEKGAEFGNSDALYYLGRIYADGLGVEQDDKKALEFFKNGVDADNASCKVEYAIFLAESLGGLSQDLNLSITLLEQAWDQGNNSAPDVLNQVLSRFDYELFEPNHYYELSLRLAELGYAEAQFNMSIIYNKNENFPIDREKAREWEKKSADNGYPPAQAAVGFEYMIEEDGDNCIKYWEMASQNGMVKVMSDLAHIYLFGEIGIPVNIPRAIALYTKSAEAGYSFSQYVLGTLYRQGEYVDRDWDKAIYWLSLAAENNEPEALKGLAVTYYKKGDVNNATSCYTKLSDSGDMEAKYLLGLIYLEDRVKNVELAKTLFRQVVADRNNEYYYQALEELGTMAYARQDYSTAFHIFSECAEHGEPRAQCKLGVMYITGNGVAADLTTAEYWVELADKAGYPEAKEILEDISNRRRNNLSQQYRTIQNSSAYSQQKSGGCYIATAIYGSYDCPEVWTLRRYRDFSLARTWYGRSFIHLYYAISPTLVKLFGKTAWFRRFWKARLDKMVLELQKIGYESTKYNDILW